MKPEILTNGSVSQKSDGRWVGAVWYKDEAGERKRKSFSGTTKSEVNQKIRRYIAEFEENVRQMDECNLTLEEGIMKWLKVFKFHSVERTTYDLYERIAKVQIIPYIGQKIVSSITSSDIRELLNKLMVAGYAYNTVRKVRLLLGDYYKHLYELEEIQRNPMAGVPMIKKAVFYSAQGKEVKAACDEVTIFTSEEIAKIKEEAMRKYGNGKPVHIQSAVFVLLLNTGLRTGEVLGLHNNDIDLVNRVIHVRRGVKSVYNRDEKKNELVSTKREIRIGKLKSSTSRRDVPLNDTAVQMIKELWAEMYLGDDKPLIPGDHQGYLLPDVLRNRWMRFLRAAGVPKKGIHALRHTFATNMINGVRQPDGTLRSLSIKQVADILGHSTTQVTEMYYVKRDTSRLMGITQGLEL